MRQALRLLTVVVGLVSTNAHAALQAIHDADEVRTRPFPHRYIHGVIDLARPIIIMHGAADPIVSPGETEGYKNLVEKRLGRKGAHDVLAVYYIPGIGHGGAEYNDLVPAQIDALETWIDYQQSNGTSGAPAPNYNRRLLTRAEPACWRGQGSGSQVNAASQENNMKTCLIAWLLVLTPAIFAQRRAPDLTFESVPDFLKLPPGMNFGEVSGVAVNSQGHVFVFTRSNSAHGPAYAPSAAQLLEFGPNGEFIREIGKDLYAWSFAHTVRIDRDDNIWAVDKGSDMIVKFNQAGRVKEVYGRRRESADEDTKPWEHPRPPLPHVDGLFRQPTDVAWDSDGNTYITDGYINSRVAKYDRNGDWVKSWGERGAAPGQFNLPHAIVIDRNNNIYVGDRSNRRIQVFGTDGKFLRMFTIDVPPAPGTRAVNGNTPTGERLAAVIGAPNSICITPGPRQVLFVGESTFPGRLFKVSLEGSVLGVIGRSGRQLKQFSGVHQLACPSETEVYAAETSNWRVQKLILRP